MNKKNIFQKRKIYIKEWFLSSYMSIFRLLIDKKVLRILDLFLKNKTKYFHLMKISKEANVPIATTFRIINRLVSINVVEQIKIDKIKIYKFTENENSREIEDVLNKNV